MWPGTGAELVRNDWASVGNRTYTEGEVHRHQTPRYTIRAIADAP